MIKRDMPAVLEIENLSYADSVWTEEEFSQTLRRRDCIGMVVELDDLIVGFMIYSLQKTSLFLENLAVHPKYRMSKVATAMIDKLKKKLNQPGTRRKKIEMAVVDSNIGAQAFLRAMDFKAVGVAKNFWSNSDGDACEFEYVLPGFESQARVFEVWDAGVEIELESVDGGDDDEPLEEWETDPEAWKNK